MNRRLIFYVLLLFALPLNAQPIRNMAPTWSPDGNKIIYYSNRDGNNELYEFDLASKESKRLTQNNYSDVLPKYSPDGSQLVFFRSVMGDHQIYILNLQDLSERSLTDSDNNEDPNWMPSGKGIVFNSDKSGDFEIYSLDLEITKMNKLTSNELRDFTPAVSPAGNLIAFVRGEFGKTTNIWLMNMDGSESQPLTSMDHDFTPVWSPNGEVIYFMHSGGHGNNIYSISLSEKNVSQITFGTGNSIFPAVSPDGKTLAFSSNRDTGSYDLYLKVLSTGEVTRITFDSKK